MQTIKFDFSSARKLMLIAVPFTFFAVMLGSLGGGLSDMGGQKIYTIDNLIAQTSGYALLISIFIWLLGQSPLAKYRVFQIFYVIILILILLNLLFVVSTIPFYDFYQDLLGASKYY